MADRGLNGNSSLAYKGVRPVTPPNLVMHPRAPLTTDYKEFCVGDIWIDNSGRRLTPPVYPGPGDVYMLTSVARNVATWIPMVGGLMSLTGDIGGPIFGDANQNIDIIGAGSVTTSGAGNTITITGPVIPPAGAGTFPTDVGTAVQVAGSLSIKTQTATLGCGSSVSFSAPGATDLVQLNVTDANNNTIIGNLAGNATLTGTNNVALGNSALHATTTSLGNTCIGSRAGLGITTSIDNVIIGKDAAMGLTTGTPNIVIGSEAGSAMTGTEAYNILIGNAGFAGAQEYFAFGEGTSIFFHNYPGTDGSTVNGGNLFVGGNAGNQTLTGVPGSANNIGIGGGSLSSLTTGHHNQCLGDSAFNKLTTGVNNTGLGHNIGYDSAGNTGLTTGSNNILIGYAAGNHYTGAESGNILIGILDGIVGESNVTKIAGIRGVTTNVADAIPVLIDSAHQLGTVSSSIRYKQNIQDMASESEDIFNLRPVTFEYKIHPGIKQYGLIAEEVEQVMPRLVVYDNEGIPETVKYHELPVILLNEIKKLSKRIEELETKLKELV